MRPFGVFGGMFDPIHYGHLRTAHELHELLGLEAVAFVPAGDPPHRAAPLADAATRLAMVRAAVRRRSALPRGRPRTPPCRPVLHDPDARGIARRARRAAARADPRHGCLRGHRALASRRGAAALAHIVIALRPQADAAARRARRRRCCGSGAARTRRASRLARGPRPRVRQTRSSTCPRAPCARSSPAAATRAT